MSGLLHLGLNQDVEVVLEGPGIVPCKAGDVAIQGVVANGVQEHSLSYSRCAVSAGV